jgi:hypothetical protein
MVVAFIPSPGPQTCFLSSDAREVMYGGAVGGGKSEAIIMAPLRWCHHGSSSLVP